MKITKRNGTVVVYDDEKIIASIRRANAETDEQPLTQAEAASLADTVFTRLTRDNDIITTQEIRGCVCELLREKKLPKTAERYRDYKK